MALKYMMGVGSDFYAQDASTQYKVISSSGEALFTKYCYGNSTANTLVDSSGQIFYKGVDTFTDLERTVQTISSGAASSGTAISGYGVTIFNGDTGGSFQMSAPAYPQARKTIIFTQGSSIARSISSTNTTGSTDNDVGFSFYSRAATNSSAITFSTGSTVGGTLELFAVTTMQWVPLISHSSTPVFTLATT